MEEEEFEFHVNISLSHYLFAALLFDSCFPILCHASFLLLHHDALKVSNICVAFSRALGPLLCASTFPAVFYILKKRGKV